MNRFSQYICEKYNVEHSPVEENSIIEISKSVREGIMPMDGLRHPVEGNSNGWYIWAGDFSEATDFFEPIHASHLKDINQNIIRYLGLPPGYRFLMTNDGYEDVWEDKTLLDI
ncbi:hypothetical protein R1T16_06955 [Flavobacterium sp. DG1-102-2]|uniref:immunity protein Imm33 domain-containing protein n=1 Tax=Flavobacterium sp. DG1-102-2 TaxID=3081663 RepID=UPI0029492E1C|nr:hypothetical protein [Flavobacterium sp. DG1-102-2]MDV6168158.1 hypothetical protein [Flavobacterium sp. DG1-102-2]